MTPFVFRGQRGNAVGFKLSSLTRIADTKSSCNKNMTLLHYIADTCQHKFRDCLLLEADMPHVRDAAKVKWVHMMMTDYLFYSAPYLTVVCVLFQHERVGERYGDPA